MDKNIIIGGLIILIIAQNFMLYKVNTDSDDIKALAIERGVASYNTTTGYFEWSYQDE